MSYYPSQRFNPWSECSGCSKYDIAADMVDGICWDCASDLDNDPEYVEWLFEQEMEG